jgi:folate-binding protein YgfZ
MMQSQWCTFLRDKGANIDNGVVTDFGNPDKEIQSAVNNNTIVDLSHLAIIKVTGDDATEFLHGQFTSDLKTISKQEFQFSAWCNPKGRIVANFLLLKMENGFLLLLPEDIKLQFMQRLQMYILRADVTLHDESESLIRIGLSCTDLTPATKAIIEAFHTEDQMQTDKSAHLYQIHADKQRYIIIGTAEVIQPLWNTLTEDIKPSGINSWALLDILAGHPWVTATTSAMFLPQMLNLDALGGLIYQKGCYPGQEIITRLYQRGQLKRKMFLVRSQDGPDIKPGQNLYHKDDNQAVGSVVNVSPDSDGGCTMLAVVDIDKANSDCVIPEPGKNSPLTFLALDYHLDE